MATCGDCRFYRAIDASLVPAPTGLCHGAPPVVVAGPLLRQPDGTITPDVQSFRPFVQPGDLACRVFDVDHPGGNA